MLPWQTQKMILIVLCDNLNKTIETVRPSEILIINYDFNATLESTEDSKIVNWFVLANMNERGDWLLRFSAKKEMVVTHG